MSALWGITTFFNPTRSRRRIENFKRFREASARQGLPLVAVELAFDDADFELEQGADAELLVQRRSSCVLWQKERLLNLAVEALPPECSGVCWIDADLLFADDDWIEECGELLREHVVFQPFSTVIRLPPEARPEDFPAAELGRRVPKGSGDGTYAVSLCSRLGRHRRLRIFSGSAGYAWCARRSFLDEVGLYDRCIVGGGDRELALAIAYAPGRAPRRNIKIHHARSREHMRPWQARVHAAVDGRIGHRAGLIHHLSHGSQAGRSYDDRHTLLIEHDFDPEHDLTLDEGGCWAWTGTNPGLRQAVAAYFESRREDG